MQSPESVLSNLSNHAMKEDYKYDRLYRNLYNLEFYKMAYYEMSSKEGNMTKGIDEKTINDMYIDRMEDLINKIKDHSYQPNPVRRVYIEKKNNSKKKRPLGIPTIDDKMVQYVIKYILDAIYEKTFSESSHGFRPNRSCHTALREIKIEFTGVKWFVEGDIKGFFDNIDHHILINILRKKIKDENFIGLIWKFLKAGYLEDWQFNKTFSGTPQGGIVSPILANIYLNELDKYIKEYAEKFNKGEKKSRTRNKNMRYLETKLTRTNKKAKLNWNTWTQEEKNNFLEQKKQLTHEKLKYPYYEPMDENYKRIKYVRYADDFLIGIIGSKQDATNIKADIKKFLEESLKLELSEEKTLITHSNDRAKFLGYEVFVKRTENVERDKNGNLKRTVNLRVALEIPHEAWRNKLMGYKVLKINKDKNNKEVWEPIHRPELAHLDDLEILSKYNAEIRGNYNYYKYADNATVLQKFFYVMEYSMYKTFANKYKSSIGKVKNKFSINGKFAVKYKTKKGIESAFLYDEGFKKQDIIKIKYKLGLNNPDTLPKTAYLYARTSLIQRLNANVCEICGNTESKIHMHHVRKLKDIKGMEDWKRIMISKKRKSIAVCEICHKRINKQQIVDTINNTRQSSELRGQ